MCLKTGEGEGEGESPTDSSRHPKVDSMDQGIGTQNALSPQMGASRKVKEELQCSGTVFPTVLTSEVKPDGDHQGWCFQEPSWTMAEGAFPPPREAAESATVAAAAAVGYARCNDTFCDFTDEQIFRMLMSPEGGLAAHATWLPPDHVSPEYLVSQGKGLHPRQQCSGPDSPMTDSSPGAHRASASSAQRVAARHLMCFRTRHLSAYECTCEAPGPCSCTHTRRTVCACLGTCKCPRWLPQSLAFPEGSIPEGGRELREKKRKGTTQVEWSRDGVGLVKETLTWGVWSEERRSFVGGDFKVFAYYLVHAPASGQGSVSAASREPREDKLRSFCPASSFTTSASSGSHSGRATWHPSLPRRAQREVFCRAVYHPLRRSATKRRGEGPLPGAPPSRCRPRLDVGPPPGSSSIPGCVTPAQQSVDVTMSEGEEKSTEEGGMEEGCLVRRQCIGRGELPRMLQHRASTSPSMPGPSAPAVSLPSAPGLFHPGSTRQTSFSVPRVIIPQGPSSPEAQDTPMLAATPGGPREGQESAGKSPFVFGKSTGCSARVLVTLANSAASLASQHRPQLSPNVALPGIEMQGNVQPSPSTQGHKLGLSAALSPSAAAIVQLLKAASLCSPGPEAGAPTQGPSTQSQVAGPSVINIHISIGPEQAPAATGEPCTSSPVSSLQCGPSPLSSSLSSLPCTPCARCTPASTTPMLRVPHLSLPPSDGHPLQPVQQDYCKPASEEAGLPTSGLPPGTPGSQSHASLNQALQSSCLQRMLSENEVPGPEPSRASTLTQAALASQSEASVGGVRGGPADSNSRATNQVQNHELEAVGLSPLARAVLAEALRRGLAQKSTSGSGRSPPNVPQRSPGVAPVADWQGEGAVGGSQPVGSWFKGQAESQVNQAGVLILAALLATGLADNRASGVLDGGGEGVQGQRHTAALVPAEKQAQVQQALVQDLPEQGEQMMTSSDGRPGNGGEGSVWQVGVGEVREGPGQASNSLGIMEAQSHQAVFPASMAGSSLPKMLPEDGAETTQGASHAGTDGSASEISAVELAGGEAMESDWPAWVGGDFYDQRDVEERDDQGMHLPAPYHVVEDLGMVSILDAHQFSADMPETKGAKEASTPRSQSAPESPWVLTNQDRETHIHCSPPATGFWGAPFEASGEEGSAGACVPAEGESEEAGFKVQEGGAGLRRSIEAMPGHSLAFALF